MKQILNSNQETLSNILNTIDCIRSEKGYSINRLAVESELSENTVKYIFKKKSFPSIPVLMRLCETMELSLWEFFLLASGDEMQPHKEYELLTAFEKLGKSHKDLVIYITNHLSE